MEMIEESRPPYRLSDGFKKDDDTDLEIIGLWTEIKLSIIKDYAAAYSKILAAQVRPKFHHVYVDAFAGAGKYQSRTTGLTVDGSWQIALDTQPPFRDYYFIDLANDKIRSLQELSEQRDDVHVFHGDCNEVLVSNVLPEIQYSDYRRGLCLLDPYGLNLHWNTVTKIAEMRSIEVFINFPMMDVNRNALWKNPDRVSAPQAARLTRVWGDESWRKAFYASKPQLTLWGETIEEKVADNEAVAAAYQNRLREAGFRFVPDPIPMRNSINATVYYLFFASYNDSGANIVGDIFKKYRR